MKFPLLSRVLILFLAASGCMAQSRDDRAGWKLDPDAPKASLDEAGKRILELTNAFRAENDLPALKPNKALEKTAVEFGRFMARTHEYGHQADGRQPSERAEAQGYDYCMVLENIAMQFRSDGFTTDPLAEELVQGWKDSPGHRKAMLDPHVTETGMAVAISDNGVYYAVQMFGRPKSMMFEVRVENRSRATISYSVDGKSYETAPRVIRTHKVCIPPQLKFTLPDGSPAPADADLKPKGATTYTVTGSGDRVQVKVTRPK